MRLLVICGSPRPRGNTMVLVRSAVAEARAQGVQARVIQLNQITFKPCQACEGCSASGICILCDGLRPIYPLITQADIVIVASPIYFGSVSAQLKMFIDRMQCIWVRSRISSRTKKQLSRHGKSGIFLATAASADRQSFYRARKEVRILLATLGVFYRGSVFADELDTVAGRAALGRHSAIARALVAGEVKRIKQEKQ